MAQLRSRASTTLACAIRSRVAVAVLALLALHPLPAKTPEAARLALLREAFRYAPVAATTTPAEAVEPSEQEPAIVLERLTITESIARRDLAKRIQERWAEEAGREFSWRNGGWIVSKQLGGTQLDLGAWPMMSAGIRLQFLRIRW